MRGLLGMQGKDMAARLGIPPQTLSTYETGRREMPTGTVSKLLRLDPGLDARWFLLGDGELETARSGVSRDAVILALEEYIAELHLRLRAPGRASEGSPFDDDPAFLAAWKGVDEEFRQEVRASTLSYFRASHRKSVARVRKEGAAGREPSGAKGRISRPGRR